MQSNEPHSANNNKTKYGHAATVSAEKGEFEWEKDLLHVIENSQGTKEVPLTKDEATTICRQKGMGDSKIHELMNKLTGTVSLENLEELFRQFPQGDTEVRSASHVSDSNSCGSSEMFNEDGLISTVSENDNASTMEQAIASANGESSSRGTNFLEWANTLHFAALASLKSDSEKKLKRVIVDRDSYKNSLKECREEKKRLIEKCEKKLREQNLQAEQQATELHSVIAELRKKLDQASVNCIAEEDEEEDGTPSSDERGNFSNDSQGGSDQGDPEDARIFNLAEPRTSDSDQVDEVHFKTLSKTNETLQSRRQKVDKPFKQDTDDENEQLQLSRTLFLQFQEKLTELKDQCQELEKKKHLIEKQIQQASVMEYVNRKASTEGNELQQVQQQVTIVSQQRDSFKAKVKKLEQELDKSKVITLSLREERDSLRKQRQDPSVSMRVSESSFTSVSRMDTSDGSEPASPRPQRPRAQPTSAFTAVKGSRQNSSQFSPRLMRPRVSSTPTSPEPRRHSMNKSWQLGDSPSSSLQSMKHSPPSSVKSAQGVWKETNVSSDLGSSVVSCPDAIPVSRQRKDSRSDGDNKFIEGLTGEKLIKILHQLPEMPESVVNTLQSCQTLREVFHALHTHWTQQSGDQIQEYQIEVERLRTKLEHIRAQNNVVALSMEESKSNSEQLSLLIGKYESQCTALQVELECCYRTIDGYEALVYLLESEQEVLNTNCSADGIELFRYRTLSRDGRLRCDVFEDDDDHVATGTYERRRHAEAQARALLQKYDKGSDGNVSTGGSRPWEELSTVSRTSATSSTGSSAELDLNKEEEGRLRGYLARLRDKRETVRTTLLELQSVHEVYVPVARIELDYLDPKLDLENAVLMQELMALKEEKAELRAKVYLTEKEKKALELQLSSREAQEQAYVVHIEHLKSEVKDQIKKRRKLEETAKAIQGSKASDGEASSGSVTPAITLAELRTSDEDIPADLYEAARREKKLKARIRELVDTLENLSKSAESRHQQAGEYIADLKRANGALVAAYEKAKKKHTTRVKKLESQMMTMMEKHEKQIGSLRERISMQDELETTHPNETAL